LVLLVQLVPTVLRVRQELLDLPVLLVPEVPLVTVVRLDLLARPASLDLLVQMGSLVRRESWARVDRRVTLVLLALRDPLGPLVLWVPLVSLELKEPVVLRELLVLLVSLVLLGGLDLLVPMVTLVLLALLAPLVKTVLREFAEMAANQADREMLGYEELLEPLARRESLERTDPLVPMGLQDLRDWLDLVVLLVCLGSVERGASPAFLDLLESQASRELLVLVATVDPLDLLDPLA